MSNHGEKIVNVVFDDRRTRKHYDVAWRSGIGAREYQQDHAYCTADDKNLFAVVCDGMGGMSGGAQASSIAVEAFTEYCLSTRMYSDDPGQDADYDGIDTRVCFDSTRMRDAAEAVDDIVYSLTDPEGNRMGAGTTLLSAAIQDNWMYWLSVGDSRGYIFRGDEMVQVTSDHNYFLRLNQLLETGVISREKYEAETVKGEALISFIGMGGLMLIDINEEAFPLQEGDTVLLCTDGMYRTLSDTAIKNIVENSFDMEEAARRMEQIISERRYSWQDNYTFILIKVN